MIVNQHIRYSSGLTKFHRRQFLQGDHNQINLHQCYIIRFMMLLVISSSFTIYFIFVSIIHPITASDNTSNQTSWRARSKRSVYRNMPIDLELRVRYPTGEEVDLHLTKRSQYLANEYLPVMTTYNYLMPDVMTNVGEFIMYQDKEKCSAIVYFVEIKKFFGVVGTNYYIRNFPFYFDVRGKCTFGTVGEPYVRENEHPFDHIHPAKTFPPASDSEAWEHFLQSNSYNLDTGSKHALDEVLDLMDTNQIESGVKDDEDDMDFTESHNRAIRNPSNEPKKLIYRLETLVVITRDIAQPFKIFFGVDHYIEWIVRNYIIYFNAVDMMFQKLRVGYAKFYINIAGIIIEDELMPFEFEVNNNELQFIDTTTKLAEYLRSKNFPPDSFDHVFIHTYHKIMDDTIRVLGLTKQSGDLFEARKINKFYETVSMSIVRFEYFYADYIIAVHEFGRVLKFKLDSHDQGSQDVGQCFACMQRRGPKCDNCLKWSKDSRHHYDLFLSKNRNRCFFMNYPRSLRPPIVYRDLTPHRQCLCFGYKSHIRNQRGNLAHVVGLHGCTEPLQCIKVVGDESYVEATVLPFDGTRCTHSKACWHGECLPYLNYPSEISESD